jgi:hypothetical protein
MMRHSPPDQDGATRWRCPFCAGFLRSRTFPRTMRRAKTVPLVPVGEGCEKCCNGILTAQAAEMAWWQRITYGTTAWRISMGRRQVVESVNAALKGVFTDLGRGFMRVMGVTKMTVMLGFTMAAYNLDRIRSFRAKHHLDETGQPTEKPKRTRARRRTGTWADVIESAESPPD